jgi:hypothetical protein
MVLKRYSRVINKLPINGKKKNFLLRHGKAGLIGAVAYPALLFLSIKATSSVLMSILVAPLIIFQPLIRFIVGSSGCEEWGCLGIAFLAAMVFSVFMGYFIGIIIGALISRSRR